MENDFKRLRRLASEDAVGVMTPAPMLVEHDLIPARKSTSFP